MLRSRALVMRLFKKADKDRSGCLSRVCSHTHTHTNKTHIHIHNHRERERERERESEREQHLGHLPSIYTTQYYHTILLHSIHTKNLSRLAPYKDFLDIYLVSLLHSIYTTQFLDYTVSRLHSIYTNATPHLAS